MTAPDDETVLFHTSNMPPKPVQLSLTVTYFADLEDLAPVMDYVHSSEFLEYHLEARSADRWTALNVSVRQGVALPTALQALATLHERALAAHLSP